MNTFDNILIEADNKTTDAFANITEAGIYKGHLMAFACAETTYNGETSDKVFFTFDLLNSDGAAVHVKTKPCTCSFTDKSNLPKIWNVKNGAELDSKIYDKDRQLQALPVECMVDVDIRENGAFPRVVKVTKILDSADFGDTTVHQYDLSIYGTKAQGYKIAQGYTEEQ